MDEYPPLATLEEMPLHSGALDFTPQEPHWFACVEPLYPADAWTMWDWRCPNCVAHARRTLRNQGDSDMIWYPTPGAPEEYVTLSWMVARSDYWQT